jgi:hypothetical protein
MRLTRFLTLLGEKNKCLQCFGKKIPKERDCLEDLDMCGRKIKIDFKEVVSDDLCWIHVDEARDQWRVLTGPVAGSYCNKLRDSMKFWQFPDWLSDC